MGLQLVELGQAYPDASFIIGAVSRSGDVIMPEDTRLLEGDEVYLVAAAEDVGKQKCAGVVPNCAASLIRWWSNRWVSR